MTQWNWKFDIYLGKKIARLCFSFHLKSIVQGKIFALNRYNLYDDHYIFFFFKTYI